MSCLLSIGGFVSVALIFHGNTCGVMNFGLASIGIYSFFLSLLFFLSTSVSTHLIMIILPLQLEIVVFLAYRSLQ